MSTIALTMIASSARAELILEKPLVNLGAIKGSVPLQHRLALSNLGDQAIEIVEVTASCGCLTPRLDQRTLQPGAKTTLVLAIRPFGQPNGPHAWNGLIRYRQGPDLREAIFTVKATIRNEVTIQPTVVALFLEGAVRQEVTVTDLRKPPFKVTQAQANGVGLRVETKTEGEGVTKVVLIADGKDLPAGRQQTILDIYTDDPVYNHFQVPVTLIKSARPTVTAVPDKVTLTLATGQKEISALVRLRGQTKVVKVETSAAAVICTWATSEEGETALRIRYRNDAKTQGGGAYSVRVYLNEPADTMIAIPILIQDQ